MSAATIASPLPQQAENFKACHGVEKENEWDTLTHERITAGTPPAEEVPESEESSSSSARRVLSEKQMEAEKMKLHSESQRILRSKYMHINLNILYILIVFLQQLDP